MIDWLTWFSLFFGFACFFCYFKIGVCGKHKINCIIMGNLCDFWLWNEWLFDFYIIFIYFLFLCSFSRLMFMGSTASHWTSGSWYISYAMWWSVPLTPQCLLVSSPHRTEMCGGRLTRCSGKVSNLIVLLWSGVNCVLHYTHYTFLSADSHLSESDIC